MKDFFETSLFFGVTLSLVAYLLGKWLQKKTRLPWLNPLLLSILFVAGVLLVSGVDYQAYYSGARYLSYLLTPATVCLAVPLYEKISLLKTNWKAVAGGIFVGVLTSLGSILLMAVLFGLSHRHYVTLLPKSVTTAIGMGISEKLGGYPSLSAAVIIITGVLGNILAEPLCKLFRITHPVAKGLAIGCASHAIGTTRALEMGKTEGAMSSLAIAVSGLLTVVGASVFSLFW